MMTAITNFLTVVLTVTGISLATHATAVADPTDDAGPMTVAQQPIYSRSDPIEERHIP